MQNKKICFVVCPIGEENSDIRESSNKLLNYLIKPVCDDLGFECIRVDELNNPNSITSDIINNLKVADLVIADLSEHNPNAFYEIGYRKALGLPIIHIKNKSTPIPFDISTIRTFDYSFDAVESEEFKNRIKQTILSIKFENTKSEPSNENSDNTIDTQIFSILFNLQDDIKYIKEFIQKNNKETISLLADKLASTNKINDETLLAQTFLTEMFRNPESIAELMKLNSLKKWFL